MVYECPDSPLCHFLGPTISKLGRNGLPRRDDPCGLRNPARGRNFYPLLGLNISETAKTPPARGDRPVGDADLPPGIFLAVGKVRQKIGKVAQGSEEPPRPVRGPSSKRERVSVEIQPLAALALGGFPL